MAGLFFVDSKRAAEGGRHTEHGEEIRGDASAFDHFGIFAIRLAKQAINDVVGGERFKRPDLTPPIEVVGIRGL